MKETKCNFRVNNYSYLGHVVGRSETHGGQNQTSKELQ